MKIAYIAAGAGGMYCGSCLRDNTLAAALMEAGHDVLLIPAYTPTRTDERNVSHNRVFLGGINVYLQERFAFFRNTSGAMDRIWDSAPLLRLATRLGVSVDPVRLGRLTLSMLRGTEGPQKKEVLNLVRFLSNEVAPDVINLPNSLLISLASAIKKTMKVPVCCTLQGEDLFLEGLGEPYRRAAVRLIAAHARSVDAFIAVSHFAARRMEDYLGLDRSRIHVAPLGISLDGFDLPGEKTEPHPFTVGYLARITPEKGLRELCEAYRRLRLNPGLPPSRLSAAGYLAREQRPYLCGIRQNLISGGLSSHFRYHGELDRQGKIAFLKGLSVFSVPAPFDDSKGLPLLEAMAVGIPVVQPRRGAFAEILETTGGGILVEPGNIEALAAGILDLWRDPQKRAELGARGSESVRRHYSAAVMAEKVLSIYNQVTPSTPLSP